MNVLEWYFAFHPAAPIRDALMGRAEWLKVFPHVEAFGYTRDGTWVFFNPQGRRTLIFVTHHRDEIDDMIAGRLAVCSDVWKIDANADQISMPVLRPHLHCVTQCAALMGWRAYSPAAFRRKLRKNGARIVEWKAKGPKKPTK